MDRIMPDWKTTNDRGGLTFEQAFEQSDRSYFDVFSAFALTVMIPYEKAQNMDIDRPTSSLAVQIQKVVDGFKSLI